MKHQVTIKSALIAIIALFILAGPSAAVAQLGPSITISRDLLPFQNFTEPVDLGTGAPVSDAQVRVAKYQASLSLPAVYADGQTILVHNFSYQRMEFDYRGMDFALETLHTASYTLMMQRVLSERWSLMAMANQTVASDFEDGLSGEDFSFQAAAIFTRRYSDRVSLGYGLAYSTQLGTSVPIPLPVFSIDWNNGRNLYLKAILPSSIEFWYTPSRRVDLGLLVGGDGNKFHADTDRYKVNSPEFHYTMLTFGPAARFNLASRVHLNLETGVISMHRLEFFDGHNEKASWDLESDHFVRIGMTLGG